LQLLLLFDQSWKSFDLHYGIQIDYSSSIVS
jgi:hypothetical protein